MSTRDEAMMIALRHEQELVGKIQARRVRELAAISDWLARMSFGIDWTTTDQAPACLLHPLIEAYVRRGDCGEYEEIENMLRDDQEWREWDPS